MRHLTFLLLMGCNNAPAAQPVAATTTTTTVTAGTPAPTTSTTASATTEPNATATASTVPTNHAACERALSALARATDAAHDPNGTSEVRPPAKPGDRWTAFYVRSHGSSDIELDPTTGAVSWGSTGEDKSPLKITPALRPLVDAAKASCH